MKKILGVFICICIVILLIGIGYFENYYHADSCVESFLTSSESVKVSKIKDGYFFDGFGVDNAIIFYPGAKVETKSYAKFMNKIAQNGIDCFLIDMPLRFAFLGSERATETLNNYKYDNWCMAGHSLGGVVASGYASKHRDKIDSIILFASYPTQKIDDKNLLSIYGEKDGILNFKAYEKSKIYWPNHNIEKIIIGGNHYNFGNYGRQKGDNLPDISNDEQQDQCVNYIVEFLEI